MAAALRRRSRRARAVPNDPVLASFEAVILHALAFATRRRAREVRMLADTNEAGEGEVLEFAYRFRQHHLRYGVTALDLSAPSLADPSVAPALAEEVPLAPSLRVARAIGDHLSKLSPLRRPTERPDGLLLALVAPPAIGAAGLRGALLMGTQRAREQLREVWVSIGEEDHLVWQNRRRMLGSRSFSATLARS
jgi:hypothetical protein